MSPQRTRNERVPASPVGRQRGPDGAADRGAAPGARRDVAPGCRPRTHPGERRAGHRHRAGPLEFDEAGVIADVTERVWAPGRPLLRLHQVPTAVTSVTDVHDGVETVLDPAAYRLVDRYLRRLGGTWGEWTTVVYAPTDDSAVRRTVLVQLCQLELNVEPGMAALGRGSLVGDVQHLPTPAQRAAARHPPS